ncbi:MAG TPA: TetR/AcrR family transcriptional regulator [Ruminococcus sp.]|nr:TetR/AcrR family transcriptional regulator [Ruminococcus sp.]
MRQETAGVTESLIESAKNEFLKYGFNNANLRRISANSGVSTNSIYTRFGDKSGLFTAVVKPVADELMQIYLDSINKANNCTDAETVMDMGEEGTELVLKFIYDNFDVFRLIFCNSAGTEYEYYFDKLAEIEENFYKVFVKQFSVKEHNVNDFFIHVICRTGWQYIYEVVSHQLSYEDAKDFMKSIREYSFAGWERVLGLI